VDPSNLVSESPTNPAKRIRVSRACLQCRSRKVKCDGGEPVCRPCANSGNACTYSEAKRRGLPPGYIIQLEKYVRGLEHLLGVFVTQVEDGEAKLAALTSKSDADESMIKIWQATSLYMQLRGNLPEGTLVERHSQRKNERDIDELLDKPDIGPDNSTDPSPPPPTQQGTAGALFKPLQPLRTSHSPPQPTYLGLSSGFVAYSPTAGPPPTSALSSWMSTLTLPNRIRLLDRYFAYLHCWLPMVSKMDLIRAAYEEDSKLTNTRLLLHSAILFAQNNPAPALDLVNALLSSVLCSQATLESVQALLILSLMLLGHCQWNTSWTLAGIAVRLSVQLGLHIPGKSMFASRTWHSCCIVETLVSARLGRQPHVSDSDFNVGPLDEDGWEEWELWKPDETTSSNLSFSPEPSRSLSVFNALFQLVRLLNNLISEVNQAGFDTRPRIQKSMLFSDLSSRLQLWSRNLPEHCGLSDFSSRVSKPLAPHKVNLYLTYTTTASLFYVADGGARIFVSDETLSNISLRLLDNFRIKFSPALASPFFEYFSHITTLLGWNRKADVNVALAFIQGWPGGSLTMQYFAEGHFPGLDVERTKSEPPLTALEEFAETAVTYDKLDRESNPRGPSFDELDRLDQLDLFGNIPR
jgi:hypothetical protein